jgi:hypothetical protein
VILNIYFCGNPYTLQRSKNIFWRKRMEKQKLSIRVELKGENVKKFTAIKQYYGLVRNPEIIKFLISQAHTEIEDKKNSSHKK